MPVNRFFKAALVALLIPTASLAQNVPASVPVTSDFNFSDMGWSNGAGKLYIAWNVYDFDGRIGLCGAVRHSSNAVSRQNDTVMRKGWLKYEGKKIVRGLRFFTNAGFSSSFNGVQATCRLTNQPTGAGSLQLGVDPARVRF